MPVFAYLNIGITVINVDIVINMYVKSPDIMSINGMTALGHIITDANIAK